VANEPHPFEIPETWTWVPMGEVVEIVRGITFPASEKTKEPAPGRIACLRTANVQESIEWGDLLFVNRSFMGREDQVLKLHDIVMSMANSRELVGKVALVDHIPQSAATFGGFLGVLRPWKIDPRYAMTLLRSSYARSTLIDSSSQTTNIANISLGKLRPLPFPLPPLAEQSRIVARVDELMRLCDALEAKGRLEADQHSRLLDTLLGTLTDSATPEELAANWQRVAEHFDLLLDRPEAVDALEQTILQLAVRGLLVAQNPGDGRAQDLLLEVSKTVGEGSAVGDLPAGWVWTRLEQVAASRLGKMLDKAKNQGKPKPYLRNTNVQWRRFDLSDVKQIKLEAAELTEFLLLPGDLLICEGGEPGRCAIWRGEVREMYFQKALHRVRPRPGVFADYIAIVIEGDAMSGALSKYFTGATIKHFVGQALDRYMFPLPPSGEQARIVARVTELRRLCADLRQRLAASQATQSRLAEALVDQVA
jgi:type I restriction enzyme S subunit